MSQNLEALLEPIEPPKSKLCKMGSTLADLKEPYKQAVLDMLVLPRGTGGFSDERLSERLYRAGIPVGESVVRQHRIGTCACTK